MSIYLSLLVLPIWYFFRWLMNTTSIQYHGQTTTSKALPLCPLLTLLAIGIHNYPFAGVVQLRKQSHPVGTIYTRVRMFRSFYLFLARWDGPRPLMIALLHGLERRKLCKTTKPTWNNQPFRHLIQDISFHLQSQANNEMAQEWLHAYTSRWS